jgi:hypothetical protein
MSAIHKLGVIIKIEVHNCIRVEVIRNVWFIYLWQSDNFAVNVLLGRYPNSPLEFV